MTETRRREIHDRACLFWVQQQLDRLPVSPLRIIARNRWGVVTYRRLAELHHLSAAEFAAVCCSRDGFTIFNGHNFCVAYSDSDSAAGRIRFTLMHEIGHIVLGHLLLPGYALPWEPEDPVLEKEADFFAGCVLAPSAAILPCGLLSPARLSAVCGLSQKAAARRLAEYRLWRPGEADRMVERQLAAYFKCSLQSRADMRAAEIACDDGRVSSAV